MTSHRMLQYANWCSGGNIDEFWTSPSCLTLYQAHVSQVLNRSELHHWVGFGVLNSMLGPTWPLNHAGLYRTGVPHDRTLASRPP